MKLLLTSGGLTTEILRNKFLELLDKNPKEVRIAFVDTASKAENDTSFVENDIENIKKTGVTEIVRIDISDPKENWENIILTADVIWVEGGNTFYLLNEINKSGLNKTLKEMIEDKLYVGVSAGSIITTPTIAIAEVEPSDPNEVGITNLTALNWVDFEVSPHTPNYAPLANVEEYAKRSGRKLYAYDEEVALYIENEKVTVVGNGFVKEIN